MIDQRILPRRFEYVYCADLADMVDAIRSMSIRGTYGIGKRTGMTDGSISATWTYDSRRRTISTLQ